MLYAVHSGEMVLFLRPFGTQVLVFLYCHSLKHWHIQHEICLWTRWPHPNPSRERAKGSPPLHGNGLKIVSIISIHNLIATWRCKGVAKSVISSWDSMKRKEEHIFWVKFWNLCLKTHMVIFFFPSMVLMRCNHCSYCLERDRGQRNLSSWLVTRSTVGWPPASWDILPHAK